MATGFFFGVQHFLLKNAYFSIIKSKRMKMKNLTETEFKGSRYRSRLATFYNKKWGLCIHRSLVVD